MECQIFFNSTLYVMLAVEPIPKEKVNCNRPNSTMLQNPRNIRTFWQVVGRSGALKARLTFKIDPREDLDQDDNEDDGFEGRR